MKFHLQDSAQKKMSELFGKIKERIILKIHKMFEDPIDIMESIRNNCKKVLKKTVLAKSTSTDDDINAMKNILFMEEFKIDFTIYHNESKKFDGAWVKAYALIWDKYCSRYVQRTIKEMPTYENVIRNNHLALLSDVETLMHTTEKAKYPTLTLIKLLLCFMKVRQGDSEELFDYLS